ncbi:hypothetical protein [Streptomyces sp. NPDC005244]|uniref:hypothetical protein n=1 Tax=Streptomyces sp. NPDC005244 TaxID=3364708 RepID=UPI00367E08A7
MSIASIRNASRDDERSQGMGDVNEAAVKRKLGIPNWRNLSKDKVLKFAAAMPEMATEVRLKLIEQFPAFKDLGKADIDAVAEAHKSLSQPTRTVRTISTGLHRTSGTPCGTTSVGTTSAGNNGRPSTTASTGTYGRYPRRTARASSSWGRG